MTTTTQTTIATASGHIVRDPSSPLLTAAEHGTLMARLGRTLDAGASADARRAYAAEEMRLASE